MAAQVMPRRGLVIDTQVAQHSFGGNGTSQKRPEQGEGEAEVVLDMKDWLARSNPSVSIGTGCSVRLGTGTSQPASCRKLTLATYL